MEFTHTANWWQIITSQPFQRKASSVTCFCLIFFYLYANNSMEQRNNDVESTLGNISHEENKTISILAIILTFTRNYLIAELLKL